MLPQEKISRYTLAEYVELEKSTDELKYEFFDGEIFVISGVTWSHEQIQSNLTFALRVALRGKGCFVYPSNIRVKVPTLPPYRYPCLSALCGKAVFEQLYGLDTLINPQLIVEVLSKSTEHLDRGFKFTHYKSILSFTEYLLISPDKAHVTQFIKQNETDWLSREFNDRAAKIHLSSVDCELQLEEVYEDVVFPETTARNLFQLDQTSEQ